MKNFPKFLFFNRFLPALLLVLLAAWILNIVISNDIEAS